MTGPQDDSPDPDRWHATTRLKVKHLVLVLELARSANVRIAAERLSMTQPAATKLLQDAEEALGVRLFDRSRSGVAPTKMGEVLVFRARQMLGELEAAREDMRLVSLGRHGRLRLGSFLVATPTVLPTAIDAFLDVYPHARVSLDEGARDSLVPALLAGRLDLVVGRLPDGGQPPDLTGRVLYHEEACIVCGPGHPLARRARIPAAALGEYPWVLSPFATVLRNRLDALMTSAGMPPPEVQVESGSLLTGIALMQRRPMLSVMPAAVAHRFARKREIRILSVAIPRIVLPVGYYQRRGIEPSPLVRAFVGCLDAACAPLAAAR